MEQGQTLVASLLSIVLIDVLTPQQVPASAVVPATRGRTRGRCSFALPPRSQALSDVPRPVLRLCQPSEPSCPVHAGLSGDHRSGAQVPRHFPPVPPADRVAVTPQPSAVFPRRPGSHITASAQCTIHTELQTSQGRMSMNTGTLHTEPLCAIQSTLMSAVVLCRSQPGFLQNERYC